MDCVIHYVCKKEYAVILDSNPYLEKVHKLEGNWAELISQLKAEKFDLIIDLHKNLRSSRIRSAINTAYLSFDKLNLKKWILVNFKLDHLPEIHIVDRYFEAIQSLNVENDGLGLEVFIPDQDKVDLAAFSKNEIAKDFVAIAFGAAHYTKSIPEKKLIEIIHQVDQKIILLGGKSEMEIGERMEKVFAGKVFNGCGRLGINQSSDLIRQSLLLITADTGMMHIGAALNKKLIVIWGSTVPKFGMFPNHREFDSKVRYLENKELRCRPCSKIGKTACPQSHFKCMDYNYTEELKVHIKGLS